ncbi:MAG: acyl-CoA dehydrogenase family protein [Parahaliea sp.]
MNTDEALIENSVQRLFAKDFEQALAAETQTAAWFDSRWPLIDELGLPLSLVPEDRGGLGLAPAHVLPVLRLAGYYGVAMPLGETMLASRLLADAGLAPSALPTSIVVAGGSHKASASQQPGGSWRLAGCADRVPWASLAKTLLLIAPAGESTVIARLEAGEWTSYRGWNLARESRDRVELDIVLPADRVAAAPPGVTTDTGCLAGAALRTLAIAGAAARVLDIAVTYAGQRQQFGRPSARFQAVQQNLAVMATQTAVCAVAADMAAQAVLSPDGGLDIAIAKARSSEAAGVIAAIAHQVLGAMGFTEEHVLHYYSKRLMAWRDEYGSEHTWARHIGERALGLPEPAVWSLVTGGPTR